MRRPSFNAILTASSLPALLVASWLLYPAVFDGPTICGAKLALGLPCPGCGLTRAFACMAHGEFARALGYHLLAPLVLGLIVAWYVSELARFGRPAAAQRWLTRATEAVIVAFLFYYMARMTVFFASPAGVESVATKNAVARLVRWDFSNTHEIVLDAPPPPR